VAHLLLDGNLFLKQEDVTHHQILVAVKNVRPERVLLSKSWNDGLMDLESDVLFNLSANRFDHFV
jgi:hypothetical protein